MKITEQMSEEEKFRKLDNAHDLIVEVWKKMADGRNKNAITEILDMMGEVLSEMRENNATTH